MISARKKVAVIGGGWAGCAAAVELSRRGHGVTLFESARTLGGRARRVEIEGLSLDNGQHILLGAYTATSRLLRLIGVDPGRVLLKLPLQLRYPQGSGGMEFIAPRLPAPLHLIAAVWLAGGLVLEDKLSLARFATTARWMDWQLHNDCTVAELLARFDQSARLVRLMWQPLCIAALNTPPERASAQVFLNVLRDSFGARRVASDMLIPRVDLTSLMPQRAADFIERQGGKVRLGATVEGIRRRQERWQLETGNGSVEPDGESNFDAIVVATQADHAAALLRDLPDAGPDFSFEYEPITTCYLQYAPNVGLPHPFLALPDDPAAGHWGQFVFDRGRLDPAQAGLLAVVVSASAEAIAFGHDRLAGMIATQLSQVFRQSELARPRWTKVISEKRATFSCTPGLTRPGNATALEGLVLAGDYTAGGYPATLESAVRSGIAAADCLER